VTWKRWKSGWRTKIVKKNGLDTYEWIKTAEFDDSYNNFRKYLFYIMMYAGTQSLSKDMTEIDLEEIGIGDAFVEGGPPGSGHGVIVLDMATDSKGNRIMLLGQSYMPAQDFHILKNPNSALSPWFKVGFDDRLETPEWIFSKDHARRFNR
jgi:hypothetical protein